MSVEVLPIKSCTRAPFKSTAHNENEFESHLPAGGCEGHDKWMPDLVPPVYSEWCTV